MKRQLPSPCPRCETPQPFPLRLEVVEDDILRQFISCTICPYRQDIGFTTVVINHLRLEALKLMRRARQQKERHGYVAATTKIALEKKTRKWQEELGVLNTRLAEMELT